MNTITQNKKNDIHVIMLEFLSTNKEKSKIDKK